jgi:hypothetical protein
VFLGSGQLSERTKRRTFDVGSKKFCGKEEITGVFCRNGYTTFHPAIERLWLQWYRGWQSSAYSPYCYTPVAGKELRQPAYHPFAAGTD